MMLCSGTGYKNRYQAEWRRPATGCHKRRGWEAPSQVLQGQGGFRMSGRDVIHSTHEKPLCRLLTRSPSDILYLRFHSSDSQSQGYGEQWHPAVEGSAKKQTNGPSQVQEMKSWRPCWLCLLLPIPLALACPSFYQIPVCQAKVSKSIKCSANLSCRMFSLCISFVQFRTISLPSLHSCLPKTQESISVEVPKMPNFHDDAVQAGFRSRFIW